MHAGGGGGYDAAPPVSQAAPNPFTDYATSGTEKNETIYVRNVCSSFDTLYGR
jgi:hypothetical protein